MEFNKEELEVSRETHLEVDGVPSTGDEFQLIHDQITLINTHNQTVPTRFFALGGLGEVGKNTYCIEHEEEIVIIDAGIKFLNKQTYPGFSGIVAGIEYLKENKNKIKYLFITHGHEDHIGGITYMLKQISIEAIYSPVLCAQLIQKKLKEHNIKDQKIIFYNSRSIFKTKYFIIDFYKVNHSIPDSFGICIGTPNGIIVTSGDFRFDFGIKNDKFDIHKLQQISVRKIDLLLCESTNSFLAGFNQSEKLVISELNNIISSSKGRVIITFFASNLARTEEIINIAINLKKKILILGRSIESSIEASQKIGYLKVNKSIFISTGEINNYSDNQILIICTGSQGEENSALSNVSKNKYPWMKLKSSDNIIFSSNVIPGNFMQVNELINRLYKSGCNIFTNSPENYIHTSGHASKIEQQLFINLVKPKFVIPIHGETAMQKELKKNCIEIGIPEKNIFILGNGKVAELLNRELSLKEEVIDTTPLFIVANEATKCGPQMLEKRNKLGSEGILMQHIFLDLSKKVILAISPITNVGSFYTSGSISTLKKINKIVSDEVYDEMKNNPNIDQIKKRIEKIIFNEIWKAKKQKPILEIFITDITKEKLLSDLIRSN